MKGIVLAGGEGTRLYPSTKATSKHLLAVFSKPMLYYPLETLIDAGIQDILIITGTEHMGSVVETLGSGKDFGVHLTYKVQDEASGIAHALLLAESFADNDEIAVILGDNYFEENIEKDVQAFHGEGGAKVFLKEVSDPKRFGVAEIENDKVVKIVEKPKHPKSNLAVTGLYFYNFEVFDFIKEQDYSLRQELEISDTNQRYIEEEELGYRILEGYWSDMGLPSTLLATSLFIANKEKNKNAQEG